jgi:hypothetical protein
MAVFLLGAHCLLLKIASAVPGRGRAQTAGASGRCADLDPASSSTMNAERGKSYPDPPCRLLPTPWSGSSLRARHLRARRSMTSERSRTPMSAWAPSSWRSKAACGVRFERQFGPPSVGSGGVSSDDRRSPASRSGRRLASGRAHAQLLPHVGERCAPGLLELPAEGLGVKALAMARGRACVLTGAPAGGTMGSDDEAKPPGPGTGERGRAGRHGRVR